VSISGAILSQYERHGCLFAQMLYFFWGGGGEGGRWRDGDPGLCPPSLLFYSLTSPSYNTGRSLYKRPHIFGAGDVRPSFRIFRGTCKHGQNGRIDVERMFSSYSGLLVLERIMAPRSSHRIHKHRNRANVKEKKKKHYQKKKK